MSFRLSTFAGICLLITIALLAAVAILIPRFRNEDHGRQWRNLVFADRYVRQILPIVQQDVRFREIRLDTFTGHDGSVMVSGHLKEANDYEELKNLIRTNPCSVAVLFHVEAGTNHELLKWEIIEPSTRR